MNRSYAYKFKWLIDNDYIVALYVIVSKSILFKTAHIYKLLSNMSSIELFNQLNPTSTVITRVTLYNKHMINKSGVSIC